MSNVMGKCWGRSVKIFDNGAVSVHRIEVVKGGYCSKHKHNHRFNQFFVESGKLRVQLWKREYNLTDITVLGPGESTTAAPGEFHTFEALAPTVAYEIYYTENTDADIVRESCGGVKK